jgi:hypothetical protein
LGGKRGSEVEDMQDWTVFAKDWTPFIQSVLLVGLGWLLGGLRPWLQKGRGRKANWLAMKAEVSIWKRKAEQFKEDQILGPLYRLPIINFWNALMNLIMGGFDKADEIDRLSDFFINAKGFNRGLDNIDSFLRAGFKEDADEIIRENTRNRVYASEIIRLHPNVSEIFNKHL